MANSPATDLSSLLPEGRTVLRATEVSKLLDCSVSHVINLVESGDLGSVNIGRKSNRHVRVPVSELRRYLSQHDSLAGY